MHWIADHLAGVVTISIFVLAVIVDICLKFSGRISISEYIWMTTGQHPTLYSLGLFLTFGICYMVRDEWAMVMLAAYCGGHLFSGITYISPEKKSASPSAPTPLFGKKDTP